MGDNTTHIPVPVSLRDILNQLKHPGQSYGGYILELINDNKRLKNELNKLYIRRDKKGRFV